MHCFLFFNFIFLFKNFYLFLAAPPGMWDPKIYRPRMEPTPPALEAQSPNRWTAREVPLYAFLILKGTTLFPYQKLHYLTENGNAYLCS